MSYTPTNWQTGDTVTATKLNNMETGINNAANAFVVTLTPTDLDFSGTMDQTPAAITAAFERGARIIFDIPSMNARVIPQQFQKAGPAIICGGQIIYYYNDAPILINIGTSTSRQIYSTELYQLTPFT